MVHTRSKCRVCSQDGRYIEVYQRPYDPLNPVVCIDETNKQHIKEKCIPCAPGQPERVDYEYERNGVADIFMIYEPLVGKRDTVITETRTAIDYAHVLQYTSNVLYPHADKITLVNDNLNTHTPPHSTRHSSWKMHVSFHVALNGITLQNTQVG